MKSTPLWVLGTMSGTSLDGVDAAMLRTDGHQVLELGKTAYRPYSEVERQVIRSALGQWPGGAQVQAAAKVVENAHADLIAGLSGAEYVGFHGQTLAHDPKGRGTHQAGDGQALSNRLGLPVVWDFRTSDVEMGGEGAPLAPVYHFAMAKAAGIKGRIAVLNLGGVGNLTLVDASREHPEDAGALLAFDTGPANAPINDLMMRTNGQPYDEAGQFAQAGTADADVQARFAASSYFRRIPPKSLDRDSFPWLREAVTGLSPADAAATLVEVAALSVNLALEHAPDRPEALYIAGGGRKNTYLMARIQALTGLPSHPIEVIGFDGDMVEAQAFAFLAARVLMGLPTSFPSTTGVAANVSGGLVSRP